jgi:arylsulfatase A-like enzyme
MEPYAKLTGERKKYAGMLAAMDEAVGQIVSAVEKAGVRGDTLFFFCSDNGGPQPGVVTDNGKFRAGKGTLYEGGVRVAAFATWDGKIMASTSVTEPLHAVDLYPTLMRLTGAKGEQKPQQDGKDSWATIADGKPSPHEDILINTTPNSGAIRAGDWKLVVNRGKDDPDNPIARRGKEQTELFNLRNDPYEKTNLAGKHPDRVKELRARLDEYAKQAVAPKARPRPKGYVVPKVWGEKN